MMAETTEAEGIIHGSKLFELDILWHHQTDEKSWEHNLSDVSSPDEK